MSAGTLPQPSRRGPFCPKHFKKVSCEFFSLITSVVYTVVSPKGVERSVVWRELQTQMTRALPAQRRGHGEWKYELLTLDLSASLFWFLEQCTVGRHKQGWVLPSFVRLGKNPGRRAVAPTSGLAWFLIRKNDNSHPISSNPGFSNDPSHHTFFRLPPSQELGTEPRDFVNGVDAGGSARIFKTRAVLSAGRKVCSQWFHKS